MHRTSLPMPHRAPHHAPTPSIGSMPAVPDHGLRTEICPTYLRPGMRTHLPQARHAHAHEAQLQGQLRTQQAQHGRQHVGGRVRVAGQAQRAGAQLQEWKDGAVQEQGLRPRGALTVSGGLTRTSALERGRACQNIASQLELTRRASTGMRGGVVITMMRRIRKTAARVVMGGVVCAGSLVRTAVVGQHHRAIRPYQPQSLTSTAVHPSATEPRHTGSGAPPCSWSAGHVIAPPFVNQEYRGTAPHPPRSWTA